MRGAAQIRKNLIDNPGFEPGLFGTVFLAERPSTTARFQVALWDATSGALTDGFFDGAQWETPIGAAAGESGIVNRFEERSGLL